MPTVATAEQLARDARFVFRGTVEQAHAATMPLPAPLVNDRTLIVRVDEVASAPPMFAGYAGERVTVQQDEDEELLAAGARALFFTNSWLYGAALAVRSIGHLPPDTTLAGAVPAAAAGAPEPARQRAEQDRQERIERADLVVTGRVVEVRPAAALDARATRRPPSEHDPMLREAVIDVARVEKGAPPGGPVVIAFPSSLDHEWYRAPKFQEGQAGRFILQQAMLGGQRSRSVAAGRSREEPSPVYTALDRLDFEPE